MDFLAMDNCDRLSDMDPESYIHGLWTFYREHTPKVLLKTDLTAYSRRLRSLIARVTDIHVTEEDRAVLDALETNIQVKAALRQLDGVLQKNTLARGKGIYCLETSGESLFFVGDIHSDPKSLRRILRRMEFFHRIRRKDHFRVIFLGDYIDRGRCHLELIESLLTLKAAYPSKIILLRGNHDGGRLLENGEVELAYKLDPGSKEEDYFPLYLKYLGSFNPTFDVGLLGAFLDFFKTLGHCALIQNGDKRVMAVHGGLPRPMLSSEVIDDEWYAHLNALADFMDESTLDHLGNSKRHNMMWSDPAPSMPDGSAPDLREDKRRFRFSCEQFESFKTRTGIDEVVRGHQAVIEGHRIQCGGCIHTLFSSGKLEESDETTDDQLETAYAGVTPKILQLDGKGRWHVLSLRH